MALNISTEEEDLYVEKLRQKMKGNISDKIYDDDNMFRRFLRARSYDLTAAETMLLKTIRWRTSNKMDSIVEDHKPHEVLTKFLPINTIGFDRNGGSILYFGVGDLDPRSIMKCVTKSELQKHIFCTLERSMQDLDKQTKKLGKLVDKVTIVGNFDNLKLMNATHKELMEVVANLVQVYESHYPERLRAAFLINTSIYFKLVFAVIKPFLTGNTFQKIKVFGKSGWLEEILQHIDPDVWPAFLGGNRTDPDGNPLCQTILSPGGVIPECYHSKTNPTSNFSKQEGVKRLVIKRMSKDDIRLEVPHPDSFIEWEFETGNHDIRFSLLYVDESGRTTELLPKQKITTDLCVEAGMYRCEKAGTYVLEFDNTYSWMNHKEVCYRTSVVTPNFQKNCDMKS